MRAQILLFDGFDELDALGPYEVLADAARDRPPHDVRLVALGGPRPVTAGHGAVVGAQAALDEEADLLVVPGGGWNDRAPAGARAEAERGELPAAIAAAHERGATIAAVCTGTMLVAAAGLLHGRPAVTHHGALAELAAAGARVVEARVVDDGDIVTAGGVTCGLDLALHLVERELGPRAAAAVTREIEHPPLGAVHRGPRARAR